MILNSKTVMSELEYLLNSQDQEMKIVTSKIGTRMKNMFTNIRKYV